MLCIKQHRAQRIQNRLDRKKKKDNLSEHGGIGRKKRKIRKQQNRKREMMEGN